MAGAETEQADGACPLCCRAEEFECYAEGNRGILRISPGV